MFEGCPHLFDEIIKHLQPNDLHNWCRASQVFAKYVQGESKYFLFNEGFLLFRSAHQVTLGTGESVNITPRSFTKAAIQFCEDDEKEMFNLALATIYKKILWATFIVVEARNLDQARRLVRFFEYHGKPTYLTHGFIASTTRKLLLETHGLVIIVSYRGIAELDDVPALAISFAPPNSILDLIRSFQLGANEHHFLATLKPDDHWNWIKFRNNLKWFHVEDDDAPRKVFFPVGMSSVGLCHIHTLSILILNGWRS